ncbi:class I SAM-dependent methyltransferase [Burkholderia cenocepacia]|uniref:class I SAM-dependent methyltransferase n=1 Tax=Burkholderia cenocepacia TaxID=95486 RepID=UPI00158E083F|nr:methyltransferase domain-containing protein [Burkholderia cenocepacia]
MLSTVTKDYTSGDAYLNLSCPVCGCLPVPHLKHDRYFIDRCPDCDFIYVRNVPAEGSRTAAFRTPIGGALRGCARGRLFGNLGNWLHTRNVVRYAQGRRRVLQIDDGSEYLLSALRSTGKFDHAGISVAETSLSKSAALFVANGNLLDYHYPGEHFDFVVGVHVLDRVHHLSEFIREVSRILSPHGRVYFIMPRKTHIDPPERLWQFSVRALQQFFVDHGFRVIFVRSRPSRTHLSILAEKPS